MGVTRSAVCGFDDVVDFGGGDQASRFADLAESTVAFEDGESDFGPGSVVFRAGHVLATPAPKSDMQGWFSMSSHKRATADIYLSPLETAKANLPAPLQPRL